MKIGYDFFDIDPAQPHVGERLVKNMDTLDKPGIQRTSGRTKGDIVMKCFRNSETDPACLIPDAFTFSNMEDKTLIVITQSFATDSPAELETQYAA
ncbi:MAG: hypothetical protein WCV79_03120 [Candidatus Paceibacterota bacterium]